MDQDFENRWCNYCMLKTKQVIVYIAKNATYKRRRQYKCTICHHTSWLQGKRPSAESVY